MTPRRTAAAAVAASAAILGAHTAAAGPVVLHGDKVWRPGTHPAPAFVLRDQTGRRFSLRAERGKVLLLTFLDSHCTNLCPIEGRALARAQRAVGSLRRWEMVIVSVNPAAADTRASIRAFARKARWRPGDWHWLTGTRAELRAVWRLYGIEVEGKSAHSSTIYLIDRRGYERSGYAYPTLMHDVDLDIRTLIHA